MNGGFIIPSALPTRRMESRPERAEKSKFRRWEFAGFQGVNPANPANTITLTQDETSLGGWLQRSSRTTRYYVYLLASRSGVGRRLGLKRQRGRLAPSTS
jgi:hypothetical protein